MDLKLKNNLEFIKKDVRGDMDALFIVDGREGSGKSVLTLQMAYYVDPTLTLDRVCFTGAEFSEAVKKAKKYQAVVYDEAITGARAAKWANDVNKSLVELLATIRQKNLVIFMVIPSIYEMQKYFAIHRSSALIHVYRDKQGRRGSYVAYNHDAKRRLYVFGKASMSYSKSIAGWSFAARFGKRYPIDEQAYREKKYKAMLEMDKKPEQEGRISRREDLLAKRLAITFETLMKKENYTSRRISEILEYYPDLYMSEDAIREFKRRHIPQIPSKSGFVTSQAGNMLEDVQNGSADTNIKGKEELIMPQIR